jgi:cyclophilin family peptidyl-prolyl cis-trans isomerase
MATQQSLIPTTTTTTATEPQQKQPELKDDTPAAATIDYRQFLVDFYTKHNPSKLSTVDQTLVAYEGRYEEMAAKLTAKYVTKPAAAAVPSPYGLPTGTGPRCFLEFSIGDNNSTTRRVEVQLFADQAPIAVENFRALCTGEKGMCSSNSSKPLCYRNSQMHRVVPNMCVQGGDLTAGNGTGGESIYQAGSQHADMWGKFKDEVFLQHTCAGLLSYANNGPNRNGSQFFFTLRPLPHLNGKHVVFGKVIVDDKDSDTDGMSVVEEMGRLPTNAMQRPLESSVIQDCGEILPDGTEIRASQLQNGGETGQQKQQTVMGVAFATTNTATTSGSTASPFGFGLSQGSSSGGLFGASQSPFSTNTSQTTTSIFGSGKPKESAFGAGSASGGSSVGTTPFSFSP